MLGRFGGWVSFGPEVAARNFATAQIGSAGRFTFLVCCGCKRDLRQSLDTPASGELLEVRRPPRHHQPNTLRFYSLKTNSDIQF